MDNDRRALADTPKPKGQTILDIIRETAKNECHFVPDLDGSLGHVVIYDDTAAATPMDSPAGYDLGTCDQKHQRMMAYQAQRIDDLAARVAHLEATIRDWSAGK